MFNRAEKCGFFFPANDIQTLRKEFRGNVRKNVHPAWPAMKNDGSLLLERGSLQLLILFNKISFNYFSTRFRGEMKFDEN